MRTGFRGAAALVGGLLLTASMAASPAIATTDTTAPGGGELNGGEDVTLSLLVDNSDTSTLLVQGVTEAFTALHPNVTFDIEERPGGADGDNIVKTRLATGEMTDVFFYNSGSLLQALNPAESIVDLTGDPMLDNVVDAFLPMVSQGDDVFGVPFGTGMGGGILYNKQIFEDNGLEVPTTWEEFAANNDALLEAGITPVGASFGDDVDVAAVRARRLLQRRPGRARLRRAVHGQQGAIRRHAGGAARLRAPAGGLREGLVERGLRLGDLRGRPADAGRRRDRAVPDAHVRALGDRLARPGRGRQHRLLRPARRDAATATE